MGRFGPGRGRLIVRAGGPILSLAALIVVVRTMDLGAALRLVAAADPVPIAACLLLVATQVTLRSVRWRLLLPAPPAGARIPLRRIVPVLLIGYLGNAVLPARLGEPIRAYLVARRERLDAAEAFGSVVLERVVDTATLALIVFGAAWAVGAPAWVVQAGASAAVVAGGVLLALLTVGLTPIARRGVGLAARLPGHDLALPLAARVMDFARGVDRPSRSRAVVVAACLSATCWALDATTFLLVARAVGTSISPATAMLISGITVLGTAVPSAPGYVGTYDLAAAATGVALGLPASAALAVALLAHVITVLPTAVGGGISLLALDARLGWLASAAEIEGGAGPAGT